MEPTTDLQIIGKLTDDELSEIQGANRLINNKMYEVNVLRHGLQYLTNKIVADHGFPMKIRLDYKTGLVYNVPEVGGSDDVR